MMNVMPINSAPAPVQRDLGRLKDAAGQVVGTVFYGRMLAMMRESSIKGAFGHGGRGEEVFAAQLHDIYARQLGRKADGGIADAIYRRLERQQRLVSEQLKSKGGPR